MAASIDSKVMEKKAKVERLRARMQQDRRTIVQLEQEINQLEAQRIIGLVNQLNIPFDQLEAKLKTLQTA